MKVRLSNILVLIVLVGLLCVIKFFKLIHQHGSIDATSIFPLLPAVDLSSPATSVSKRPISLTALPGPSIDNSDYCVSARAIELMNNSVLFRLTFLSHSLRGKSILGYEPRRSYVCKVVTSAGESIHSQMYFGESVQSDLPSALVNAWCTLPVSPDEIGTKSGGIEFILLSGTTAIFNIEFLVLMPLAKKSTEAATQSSVSSAFPLSRIALLVDCLSETSRGITRHIMASLLEFVQYHTLQGAAIIVLAVSFDSHSEDLKALHRALRSFDNCVVLHVKSSISIGSLGASFAGNLTDLHCELAGAAELTVAQRRQVCLEGVVGVLLAASQPPTYKLRYFMNAMFLPIESVARQFDFEGVSVVHLFDFLVSRNLHSLGSLRTCAFPVVGANQTISTTNAVVRSPHRYILSREEHTDRASQLVGRAVTAVMLESLHFAASDSCGNSLLFPSALVAMKLFESTIHPLAAVESQFDRNVDNGTWRDFYYIHHRNKVITALQDRRLGLFLLLPLRSSKPFPPGDSVWPTIATILSSGSSDNDPKLANFSDAMLEDVNDSSKIHSSHYVHSLPSWSADASEFVLGAILERDVGAGFGSETLAVSVQMLSHAVMGKIKSREAINGVNPAMASLWRYVASTWTAVPYDQSGLRNTSSPNPQFSCRVFVTSEEVTPMVVFGQFLPNDATHDPNANKCHDTLRCELPSSDIIDVLMKSAAGRGSRFDRVQDIVKSLVSSHESMIVEIIRDKNVVVSFPIPWEQRFNSKFLQTYGSSHLDLWSTPKPITTHRSRVAMCVPGIDAPPNYRTVAALVEFVQFHSMVGVSHIFLSFAFGLSSPYLDLYVQALQTFIDEGLVSVSSQSLMQSTDFLYSWAGVSWNRDFAKVVQVNLCSSLLRGWAHYVAIWDVDEYFIPKFPKLSIQDVIEPLAVQRNGLADFEDHPYCFFLLNSEVLANAPRELSGPILWIGDQYPHLSEPKGSKLSKQFSFEKSILPLDRVFHSALHLPGVCRMPFNSQYTSCTNSFAKSNTSFCAGDYSDPRRHHRERSPRTNHQFNEFITRNDSKLVNSVTDAVIYHFMLHRVHQNAIDLNHSLSAMNDYSRIWFGRVKKALLQRNFGLMDLPVT